MCYCDEGIEKDYKLIFVAYTTIIGNVVVTSTSMLDDDVTKLWHMHLGHISENGMIKLSRRGLLNG